MTPERALEELMSQRPRRLGDMPEAIGLYALGDHDGKLHYFGMTTSDSFRDRIWKRHVAGSERESHKLSCNYAVGRMWHDRKFAEAKAQDGKIARRLRREFIRRHCCFACLPLTLRKDELAILEARVIALAWPDIADWNKTRRRVATFDEPRTLVDEVIRDLDFGAREIEALDRQDAIYRKLSRCA